MGIGSFSNETLDLGARVAAGANKNRPGFVRGASVVTSESVCAFFFFFSVSMRTCPCYARMFVCFFLVFFRWRGFKRGKHLLVLLGFGYTIPLVYLYTVFLFSMFIDVVGEYTRDPMYQLENITVTDQRFPALS